MRRLTVLEGRASPATLEVGDGEVVIGRAKEAELQVHDETASRRHACVRTEGGRTTVEDLGSANGTRLNGERLTAPAVLFEAVLELCELVRTPSLD